MTTGLTQSMLPRCLRLLAVCCALLGLGLLLTATASAKSPIYSFSVEPSRVDAGAHPNVVVRIAKGTTSTEPPVPCHCNNAKDLVVNTPPGLGATPTLVPQCTLADFALRECSPDSQLGVNFVGGGLIDENGGAIEPIYNLLPRPGQLALQGTFTPLFPNPTVFTVATVRTESDYGVEFQTLGLSDLLSPPRIMQILWGVPADPIHDPLRWKKYGFSPLQNDQWTNYTIRCDVGDPIPDLLADKYPVYHCPGWIDEQDHFGIGLYPDPVAATVPPAPYVTNPTACGATLSATLETRAYDLESDFATTAFPAITGCDRLKFDPSLAAKPTTTAVDSPSGLDISLTVPQTLSPTVPSPSAIRAVKVELPEGFTVNPNAADGKASCTAAQARFGTREPAQCPEFAKVGTLGVTSSSFPGVLPGAIYLGEPLPGNRYRLFLVFDGFSLHVKLPGVVTPDPQTGQLTASFEDLPQFNFQQFDMHFFGAERGLLATPEQCGTYAVHTTFTPWAAPDVPNQTSTQFFTIDSGPGGSPCPGATRPFGPSFEAGVTDATAAKHTTFTLDLARPDGDQNLTGLTVKTPPGFSATLKGIPYCPEAAISQLALSSYTGLAEQASSACSAASLVGSATAGAGAGSKPLYVGGKVYLAGPYKGAPLSLEVVIPAVSGPYDLGNVAVRAALNLDPTTAQVTTVSDPLPQILEGIPLRTRFIRVDLDRKDFALNPTNCDPFSVDATATGDEGASANLSSHFQVANCSDLAFSPKLYLKLNGGAKRNGHPAIHANLAYTSGQANIKSVAVTLPRTEQLDSAHIGTACTTPQFDAGQCPSNSILGTASASTPLLDNPLKGTAYLVSSGNPLPDIVLALRGQFAINVHGIVSTAPNGGLRTTFKTIPDVPVSSFRLDLQGGRKGLIVNNTDICKANLPATALVDAQNGRTADQRVALHPSCAKARHKSHHKRHR